MTLPSWVSPFADIVSFIGLGITLWVLVETKLLKKSFALRARTPGLRKSLAKIVKSLPEHLKGWPSSKNDVVTSLTSARAILENLQRKLPRSERGDIERLISKLKGKRHGLLRRLTLSEYCEEELWAIHADLQGIVVGLEQREKDASWG